MVTLEDAYPRADAMSPKARRPRTALVHDWLVTPAGAEKALAAIHGLFPAPVYTLVYRPETARVVLGDEAVQASFLQRLPFASRLYRNFLPLFPAAIESLDLSSYELLVSSSHAAAKGIRKGPEQLHICYCYTPMRYAWDLHDQYMRSLDPVRRAIARPVLARLRRWDRDSSARVDHYVAISRCVAERIRRSYGRDADVIYPPVDVEGFRPAKSKGAHFITVSRLVPYKRVDLIVEAFSRLGLPLVVVGDGPQRRKVAAKAGPTVTFAGSLSGDQLKPLVAQARAFVFAAEEDFGIAPVEALACGTPVIGYGVGGLVETVEDRVHGIHFKEQTVESLCAAVRRFQADEAGFDPAVLRRQAERFSTARFEREFKAFVEEKWSRFAARRPVAPVAAGGAPR